MLLLQILAGLIALYFAAWGIVLFIFWLSYIKGCYKLKVYQCARPWRLDE